MAKVRVWQVPAPAFRWDLRGPATLHEDERLIEEILRAGARGYVLKSDVSGAHQRGAGFGRAQTVLHLECIGDPARIHVDGQDEPRNRRVTRRPRRPNLTPTGPLIDGYLPAVAVGVYRLALLHELRCR